MDVEMAEELKLARPLVAFDVETTGLDVNADRIVEISCVKLGVDGSRECRTHRLNPQIPIGADATAVHGISDADVAHEPTFTTLAPTLYEFFDGADLTGFNIEQFDLPLLKREFGRVNITFPAGPVNIIDSWRIFLRHEPRDLRAALRFYCGRDLQNAHSAEADAQAAADILLAQVRRYTDLPRHIDALHAYCHPSNPDWLDPDGKILWRGGHAVLSFGKHKNRPLQTLAEQERDYLQWIAAANFSSHVVDICKAALAGRFPQGPGFVTATTTTTTTTTTTVRLGDDDPKAHLDAR